MNISKVDEYGITEYKPWFKVIMAFLMLYTYITLMAFPLYELEHISGNIKTYDDAFWVLQMSASTIGFGDFYPTTQPGRWMIAASFYIGMGLAGFIAASIVQMFTGFTDKSIQNRELRKQNAEIIELLKNKE